MQGKIHTPVVRFNPYFTTQADPVHVDEPDFCGAIYRSDIPKI